MATDISGSNQQTLDQACIELHRMVDAFKAKWLRDKAKHPDRYPDTMGDGDWFEAFLAEATTGEGLSTPEAARIETACIELCGPFKAADSKGVERSVSRITIDREGYIPDVHVWLDQDCVFEEELYDDEEFVSGVMAKLSEQGYEGPRFDRAELGMQTDRCVVLEPCSEFTEWAQARGFKLLS